MNVNDILSTATAEQLMEARNWASDCTESDHAFGLEGEQISARRAVVYVERNYPGGWEGFLAEFFPMEDPCKVEWLSDWSRDSDTYDPYARIRSFRYGGEIYYAHSRRAEQAGQWPFTVRRKGAYITTVGSSARLQEELRAALAG